MFEKLNRYAFFILVCFTLNSCDSTESGHEGEEESIEEVEFADAEAEIDLEMEDHNQSNYFNAKSELESNGGIELPDSLNLNALYEVIEPGGTFAQIYSYAEGFILTSFYSGTDVEKNYLVTWDYDGELLNYINYGTSTFGQEVYLEIITSNFIAARYTYYEDFELQAIPIVTDAKS